MDKKQKNIKLIKHLEDFFRKNAQKFNIEMAFLFGSLQRNFMILMSLSSSGYDASANKLQPVCMVV